MWVVAMQQDTMCNHMVLCTTGTQGQGGFRVVTNQWYARNPSVFSVVWLVECSQSFTASN